MTPVDIVALVVIAAYALLGWFSGTIRRVLGLITVYVAALIATNMGQFAGGILRQYNNTVSLPDARLYGWLFFLVLLIVVLEGAATAVHAQLQIAAVAVNRGIGVVLGLVTAVTLMMAVTYMLIGFANAETNQPTSLQVSSRDQLQHSSVMLPMARSVGVYVLPLLTAALPRDSRAYFVFEGSGQ